MAGPISNTLRSIIPSARSGIKNVINYVFPTPDNMGKSVMQPDGAGRNSTKPKRDLRNIITPVQYYRRRVDIQSWRDALNEAESAWFPHRVKMQAMYWDTAINGHIVSCLKKRKDLSMLREWTFKNDKNEENLEQKNLLNKKWFMLFLEYALEARFYGYQLITLGDLKNDDFPDLGIIRRINISPDRLNVTSYIYSITGVNFLEGDVADWHVWVPTPSDMGISKVGYGELYPVAQYEILNRNNKGQNADANELFGMPWVWAKTDKPNEERGDIENALATRGSSGSIVTDKQDEIEFIESKGIGQAFKTFGDFEGRNDKYISKILLGHADAIDSVPGKLGNNGDKSPAEKALADKQTSDGKFLEDVVNNILIPKLIKLGFKIDTSYPFMFENNAEKNELRVSEDKNRNAAAEWLYKLSQAGIEPTEPEKLEEIFGIKLEKAAQVVPPKTKPDPQFRQDVKNRLKEIYKD